MAAEQWWASDPEIGGASPPSGAAPAPAAPGGEWWANDAVIGGAAPPAAQAVESQPVAALAANLGGGFGNAALGAQSLVGKGLRAVGAESAGNWLVDDAAQGRAKLAAETAPYRESNPVMSAVGNLGGELGALIPAGGLIGAGVKGLGSATGAQGLTQLGTAIGSGGLTAGGAGLGVRTAGGAISGGATTALVDEDKALMGAGFGAIVPGGVALAGRGMQAVGGAFRGQAIPAGTKNAVAAGVEKGFMAPPSLANPTVANQLMEGLGGRAATAQRMSLNNQGKFNEVVRKELGMKAGEEITPDALRTIRQSAAKEYERVGNSGVVSTGQAYNDALDTIVSPYLRAAEGFPGATPNPIVGTINALRTEGFDAASGIAKLRELREMTTAAYQRGDADIGKALRGASGAVEDAIERHLGAQGQAGGLQAFQEARQRIAMTHSVESALNTSSGNVMGRSLGDQAKRGKPLSGGLKDIADFARAAPTAAQPVEKLGSVPALSALDALAAIASPDRLASVATLGVRPLLRMGAMSKPVQLGIVDAARRQATQSAPRLGVRLGPLSLAARAVPAGLVSPGLSDRNTDPKRQPEQ